MKIKKWNYNTRSYDEVDFKGPRRILQEKGWNVPRYVEAKLNYELNKLPEKEKQEFEKVKAEVESALCDIQELMLSGMIPPSAYEMMVKELETSGKSIKTTAQEVKDRYKRLEAQKELTNESDIKW